MVDRVDKKRQERKILKHNRKYPYNCVSKYYPLSKLIDDRTSRRELLLPCGFMLGQSWGALKKAWRGYKLAKATDDEKLMREYATRIQTLETQIGVPTASFPNLGMLGDIFFLYNKEKEHDLRVKYMHDNIVCDRFGVNSIGELVEQGKASIIEFSDHWDLKRKIKNEHIKATSELLTKWALTPETQKYFDLLKERWRNRENIKEELQEVKQELKNLKGRGHTERRKALLARKILLESQLNATKTTHIVRVDNGYRFVREVIKQNRIKDPTTDYEEPRFYFSDINGKRLVSNKDDPEFYELYIKGKYWENKKKMDEICIENYDKIIKPKNKG
jgi:hypothetical protein